MKEQITKVWLVKLLERWLGMGVGMGKGHGWGLNSRILLYKETFRKLSGQADRNVTERCTIVRVGRGSFYGLILFVPVGVKCVFFVV